MKRKKYFKSLTQCLIPKNTDDFIGMFSGINDNIRGENSSICENENKNKTFDNMNTKNQSTLTLTGKIIFNINSKKSFVSPAQCLMSGNTDSSFDKFPDINGNRCEEGSMCEKSDENKTSDNINTKDQSQITLTGKIVFSPDILPKDGMFNITLFGDDGIYILKLDQNLSNKEAPILKSGQQYKFQCEKNQELYYVKTYTEYSNSHNIDMAREQNYNNNEEKEKIISFERKCREKEPNSPLLAFGFLGTAHNVINIQNITSFDVDYGIERHCVIDRKIHDIESKALKNSEKYYIFGILVRDVFYVQKCVSLGEGKSFEELSPKEKIKFNDSFCRLNIQAQNELLEIYSTCEQHPKIDTLCVPTFRDMPMYDLKYNMCQEHYPPDVQSVIEKTLRNQKLKLSQKDHILNVMLNTHWGKKLQLCTDYEYIKAKLDELYYGQEYLKETIIKLFLSYELKKDKKGGAILLVGPPGVGKTSIFRTACDAYNIPFVKISMNGVDNPLFLKGTPRLYDNAIPGQIIAKIHEKGDRSVVLLDEIDGMEISGDEGNPYSALYDLLDPNEKFQDSFIEAEIDKSNMIFVLTANDISSVPPAILDRVNIIYVPDYTDEEKRVITRDYVIPKEMGKYDWQGKKLIWDDDIIDDVANRFTLTNGVRDIEKNVGSVIRSALKIIRSDKVDVFTIDKSNIEKLIDVQSYREDHIANDITELKSKFMYFKDRYSTQTKRHVVSLLHKYDVCKEEGKREIIRKQLFVSINILPSRQKNVYDLKAIKTGLDKSHFGMESVKEELVTVLAGLNAANKCTVKCILLNGPCGTGKTSISKSIAELMGRKFVKISLNGICDPRFFKGFMRTYKGAEYGSVARNLAESGSDHLLVLLDEIDKMKISASEGDPFGALLDLLDDEGMFTDVYCGTQIDVSNVLFMATSNNLKNIPESILDRMEIIELSGYTESEKIQIAERYIVPCKLREYNAENKIYCSKNVIKYIVENYCISNGIRDIDTTIDKVIRRALKDEIQRIDIPIVTATLGAKPNHGGNMTLSERMRPGIARALAVSENAGTTFAVQVTENTFGKSDEITGLPRQVILDSIKIAKLITSKLLQEELPCLHVHFAEGGVEKDGPSAGITIFAAIYSYMIGQEIDRDIAFTGEIDIYGDIWAIGGVEIKLAAAEREGCHTVFIPMDNYRQLEEEDKLSKYRCEIVPVSNINELCGRLFKENETMLLYV